MMHTGLELHLHIDCYTVVIGGYSVIRWYWWLLMVI